MLIGRFVCALGLVLLGAGFLIGCDQGPAQSLEVTPTPTIAPAAESTRQPGEPPTMPAVRAATPPRPSGITPSGAAGNPTAIAGAALSITLGLSVGQPMIAFQSFRDGQEGLYVMRDDGLDQVRLGDGADPVWSPNGRQLAFSEVRDNRDTLYVLDIGIKPEPIRLGTGFSPAWSPDGRRLAFADTRQGNADIFVINADGSGERVLRRSPVNEMDPCWAPDGKRIVFDRAGQIVIDGLDGADQAVLGDGKSYLSHPAWSADGTRIAFSWRSKDTNGDGVLDPQDDSQIALMNVDGSHRTILTTFVSTSGKPVWAQHPVWSPDGARLAFESNRDGKWDIFVVKADGSGLKNLTGDVKDSVNVSPSWRSVAR
jgi:Tol biopolymer transport system component